MQCVKLAFEVDGDSFSSAGNASESVKRTLKQIGISAECVRRVAIAMYEGEINMVIHAHGGRAEVEIYADHADIWLKDRGPGIENIELAMKEGYSTASENIRSPGFGAGIGLPNMKKYSDDMRIESTLGVGTTVYMRIDF